MNRCVTHPAPATNSRNRQYNTTPKAKRENHLIPISNNAILIPTRTMFISAHSVNHSRRPPPLAPHRRAPPSVSATDASHRTLHSRAATTMSPIDWPVEPHKNLSALHSLPFDSPSISSHAAYPPITMLPHCTILHQVRRKVSTAHLQRSLAAGFAYNRREKL